MKVIFGFITGIFGAQFLPSFPSFQQSIIIFACIIIVAIGLYKYHYTFFNYFFIAFSAGAWWLIIYASIVLRWTLSQELENKTVLIEGYIASIPIQQNNYSRFDIKLSKLENKKAYARVRLTWSDKTQSVHVGDKWRLFAKIKRPHGILNPGGYDKEKQMLINHIRAEGHVVNNAKNICLQSHFYSFPLQRVRQALQKQISQLLGDSRFLGIILALTIGMTNDIVQEQWQIFRNTGTNHLIAISGLHIGLVAGMFGFLVKNCWRRSDFLTQFLPASKIALISGSLVAIIYGALAGFSVSTQRSMIMLLLWGIAQVCYRHVSFAWVFSLSMAIVLLLNPFAIFSISFWLSYGAVGCLLYGMSARLHPRGWWWKWGRPQWVVFVGMLPLSLGFFQQISFSSMFANVIAIPWVSFLVVPELLLSIMVGLFMPRVGGFLLHLCEKLLAVLWEILRVIGQHQEFIWHYDISFVSIFLLVNFAALIISLPRGMPVRFISLSWFLPVFFNHYHPATANQIRFTVLDVGQGLASVIQTKHHTLVYDTGLKLNDHYDMGKLAILPYFGYQHVNKVDMLVVSHGDNDHIGGASSLLQHLPVARIETSVPQRFRNFKNVEVCIAGKHWQWDGVDFRFLHPVIIQKGEKSNNTSCVLRVTYGRHQILLTGDMEKSVELQLVKAKSAELHSSIIVVPHHGSKTSSSSEFLDVVKPKYAIFSYGYLNHYHHPHRSVLSRYLKRGIVNLDTVSSGAITMTLNKDSDIVWIDRYRISHHRFWHR